MGENELCERPRTAERLPTREQIEALTDLEVLTGLQDDVMGAAKSIEVDLEFRSDDLADDFWEHRARKALTAHQICNGHLTRRIAFLRRGGKVFTPADPDKKIRKAEAHAAALKAEARNRETKLEANRLKAKEALTAFADKQSFLSHFYRVAVVELDHAVVDGLMAKAQEAFERSLGKDSTHKALFK